MSTIIKRDGSVENFDVAKLLTVLQKANSENTATAEQLKDVVRKIAENVPETTAELRSLVETSLVEAGLSKVASSYIIECYKAEARRVKGYVDQSILSLIDNSNSEVMEENGNKNPVLVSTQRDLIAGETSKDIARRFIFSKESIEAHDKGAIHIHDMDYAIQNLINCHLVNLEDMLQNGTMINGVKIDRPKSLRTAVTLASQISAQVSSSTYGGQTMYLSNLSPFVDVSRQKIRAEVESELADLGVSVEKIDEIVAKRLKNEIKDSVQTFTYQINTISGTNGQSPFITVFIYLGDVKDEQGKQDLALLAEEMFKQRIKGFKNALGKWVAPTFPKLIYVLEEDNIHTDSEFYWLTELAAKCISKRMVPDLISEKVMKEIKDGDVLGAMGCLDYNETVLVSPKNTPSEIKKAKTIKIGDLYEHLVDGNRSVRYKSSKLRDRAKHIKDESDRNKFLKNGYILYSGEHFNQWAKSFTEKRGRKATKQDFKDYVGVEWDRQSVMARRGADLSLVSRWDSYLELKVCDIFNQNCYVQKFMKEDCVSLFEYVRNAIFTFTDGSRKQLDIFIPALSLGFEVNDFATHSKDNDFEPYEINGNTVHKDDYNGVKKGPSYSQAKIDAFAEIGIRVVELWEDEIRSGEFVDVLNRELDTVILTDNKIEKGISEAHNSCFDFFSLEENGIVKYVQDIDGSFVKIKSIMRNSNVDNWVRIVTTNREILVTTDHPLIIDSGQVIAGELRKGDYILNVNGEREFITETEIVERATYSYDIETETNSFVFSGVQSHNCRSFLTPDPVNHKYLGRFNLGVVSLNLPYIAYESGGNIEKFFELLEDYGERAFDAHMARVDNLRKATSDVAPILWQHGSIARLKPGEKIEKLFYDNYSTISLGYMGLYETVKFLTGFSHTDPAAKDFAISVLVKLEEMCDRWKEETGLGFSLYGTPAESLTDKFASAVKRDFDPNFRDWVTNSFHVDVEEEISAFDKLAFEAQFQEHSKGGMISYIETADLSKNIEAILALMKYMYDTIMYAEINCKLDFCESCQFEGEIDLLNDGKRYFWQCPNCGETKLSKMRIIRRVCGYLTNASVGVRQGRLADIAHRKLHL